MSAQNPLLDFARHQGVMLLDGGLATALEDAGQDLNDPLWSAKVLMDAPHVIRSAHRSFLEAGADCIASATYQATVPGFARLGISAQESAALLAEGVRLAVDTRDEFWRIAGREPRDRLRPLVAASLGPYGAFLADGSEYDGAYTLDAMQLRDFHSPRWRVFADSDADLIACETIPSRVEVDVLLGLLDESPGVRAWISLSCRDGEHMADGTPVVDAARACEAVPGVVGVGVNCVPPERVAPLLEALARGTTKPLLAYPNSGERYDAHEKQWRPGSNQEDWNQEDWSPLATVWKDTGAVAIGGCCRTSAQDIARLRGRLLNVDSC